MDKDLKNIISEYIYSQIKAETEEEHKHITDEVCRHLSNEISSLKIKISLGITYYSSK